MQDRLAYLFLEAQIDGTWQRVQPYESSWCGNSYTGRELQPGEAIVVPGWMPAPHADPDALVTAPVRFALGTGDNAVATAPFPGHYLPADLHDARRDELAVRTTLDAAGLEALLAGETRPASGDRYTPDARSVAETLGQRFPDRALDLLQRWRDVPWCADAKQRAALFRGVCTVELDAAALAILDTWRAAFDLDPADRLNVDGSFAYARARLHPDWAAAQLDAWRASHPGETAIIAERVHQGLTDAADPTIDELWAAVRFMIRAEFPHYVGRHAAIAFGDRWPHEAIARMASLPPNDAGYGVIAALTQGLAHSDALPINELIALIEDNHPTLTLPTEFRPDGGVHGYRAALVQALVERDPVAARALLKARTPAARVRALCETWDMAEADYETEFRQVMTDYDLRYAIRRANGD